MTCDMPLPSRVTASPFALSSASKSYPTLYHFLEEVTSATLYVQRPTLLPLPITRLIRSWRLLSKSKILAHSQACKSLAHIVKLALEEISFLFFNQLAAFRFSVPTSDLQEIAIDTLLPPVFQASESPLQRDSIIDFAFDIAVMHTVVRSRLIQICIDMEATIYSMDKRRTSLFL